MVTCVCIRPVWIQEELQNLVANNMEKPGNFLQGLLSHTRGATLRPIFFFLWVKKKKQKTKTKTLLMKQNQRNNQLSQEPSLSKLIRYSSTYDKHIIILTMI